MRMLVSECMLHSNNLYYFDYEFPLVIQNKPSPGPVFPGNIYPLNTTFSSNHENTNTEWLLHKKYQIWYRSDIHCTRSRFSVYINLLLNRVITPNPILDSLFWYRKPWRIKQCHLEVLSYIWWRLGPPSLIAKNAVAISNETHRFVRTSVH